MRIVPWARWRECHRPLEYLKIPDLALARGGDWEMKASRALVAPRALPDGISYSACAANETGADASGRVQLLVYPLGGGSWHVLPSSPRALALFTAGPLCQSSADPNIPWRTSKLCSSALLTNTQHDPMPPEEPDLSVHTRTPPSKCDDAMLCASVPMTAAASARCFDRVHKTLPVMSLLPTSLPTDIPQHSSDLVY